MSGPSENPLKRIVGELHRRHVWQVLAVYLGTSWAIVEATALFSERFGLPEWVFTGVVILLLVGLPVVLVTAYLQQERLPGWAPPEGRDRAPAEGAPPSPESVPEPGPEPTTAAERLFTWRNAILGGTVAFALWGIVAAGWLVFGPGLDAASVGDGPAGDARPSIAVLPLENLSPDSDNAFFADGIHEEILGQLAKIGALKVISRTSVMGYRETTKNLRTIADELDVNHVLEGSVRRAGDQVRITTQLIDARTDEHLWAESYERELADIFAIQEEVARRVARSLNAALSPAEEARISARPTDDLEAYDFFLRGQAIYWRWSMDWSTRLPRAKRMFERAVELDPEFALAHAWLSNILSFMFERNIDRSDEQIAAARRAAHRALELDPDLPNGHMALGVYHIRAHRDYQAALEEFAIARQAAPNNFGNHWLTANALKSLGRWEEALRHNEIAAQLNPLDPGVIIALGRTLVAMGRYAEAERYVDRAIALAPSAPFVYEQKAIFQVVSEGDVEGALEILDDAEDLVERDRFWEIRLELLVQSGRFQQALELLRDHAEPADVRRGGPHAYPYALRFADLFRLLERPDSARTYYEMSLPVLEEFIEEDGQWHDPYLGRAYAGLGRREDVLREGERVLELVSYEENAGLHPHLRFDVAVNYAIVGEEDRALDHLEFVLSVPSTYNSIHPIRLQPEFGPLRDHPRFQALLEEYGSR